MHKILLNNYFDQKLGVVLPKESEFGSTPATNALAYSVAANFAQFNMFLPPASIAELAKASEQDIIDFSDFYLYLIKEAVGVSFSTRRLFYPGFPNEVMEKENFEIFEDQLKYAVSGFTMMPEEKPTMSFFPFFGSGDKKMLNVATEEDVYDYIKNLFKKDMVWTASDEEFITDVFDVLGEDVFDYLPSEPSKAKENNIKLLNIIKERYPDRFMGFATKFLKTPTDVLRYAVSLVGGDVSLNGKMANPVSIGARRTKSIGFSFSKNPRYPGVTRNLTKTEIKEILALLNNTRMDISEDYPCLLKDIKESAIEDGRNDDIILVDDAVQTYKSYYKSLAKVAHINPENKENQVNRVLGAICSNKARTIMSLIEQSIKKEDLESALKYLRFRPTEFNKRLDRLCEIAVKTGKEELLLAELEKNAMKASITSLLQLHGYFESRKEIQSERIINFKGKITQKPAKDALDKDLCDKIKTVIEKSLKERYKDTPYMGKIYIDASMNKVKVPKNDKLRTSSKSLYPYTFGSSLPYAAGTNRKQFAVRWENGNKEDETSVIDIDLSATVFDHSNQVVHVGWNSSYSADSIVYSGDIREGGSAEFIDLDSDKLKELDYKALVPSLNVYDGADSFNDMLDCQMILAERPSGQLGEIYEPKTVKLSLVPKCNARQINPVALNIETGEWIWLDSMLDNGERGTNVASSNLNVLSNLVKDALFANKYNPGFDLLLKAQNCDIVTNIEDADIVFTQEALDEEVSLKANATVITQNDLDKLMVYLDDKRVEVQKDIDDLEK